MAGLLMRIWLLFVVLFQNNSFQALLPIVRQRIIDGFTPKALDLFRREFDFFDKVTSISGVLFPLPKEERRAGIRRYMTYILWPIQQTERKQSWFTITRFIGNWRKFRWREKTFIYQLPPTSLWEVFKWTVEYLCSQQQRFLLWSPLMWLIVMGTKML